MERRPPARPHPPRAALYRGQAQYLLGRLNEAEKDLQSASAAAAAGDRQLKGEALVWLALVKEKQGKKQEAQELIKQAQTINKAYGSAFEQLKALPGLCYSSYNQFSTFFRTLFTCRGSRILSHPNTCRYSFCCSDGSVMLSLLRR